MENDLYRTLRTESRGLYKEKGSRFISVALPVTCTDEVRAELEQLRREFHDARHHCYAYRIGEPPYDIRYNDDGEPSGTAGKPIFGQIQSYDLTNALVVVIRYFGGIKLGTGGLIQAYKSAARDSLENAVIITKTWKIPIRIRFNYDKMNEVMRIVKEEHLDILRQDSSEKILIDLEIRKGIIELVTRKLNSVESLEWTVI